MVFCCGVHEKVLVGYKKGRVKCFFLFSSLSTQANAQRKCEFALIIYFDYT